MGYLARPRRRGSKKGRLMMIDVLRLQDFPHLRGPNGKWRSGSSNPGGVLGPEFSLARLAEYGELLRDYRVPDWQIVAMFVDLYWDAVAEAAANEEAERAQKAATECSQDAPLPGAISPVAPIEARWRQDGRPPASAPVGTEPDSSG